MRPSARSHSAAGAPLVLVTRPESSGMELAARLQDLGCAAIWWPAFDLLAPEDPGALEAVLARLESFDLAVFVSPAAVRACGAALRRLGRAWPEGTRIAAVGAATREAARAELTGARDAPLLCPPGEQAAMGGTESLIGELQALQPAARSVLIVRAQSGRERLAEWLRAQGAAVEQASAYRRVAHVPDAAQWESLRRALAQGRRLAVLYTSSEAVAALAAQFEGQAQLGEALQGSIALCIHERIEAALRGSAGRDVRRCGLEPDSIRRALLGKNATQAPRGSAPQA